MRFLRSWRLRFLLAAVSPEAQDRAVIKNSLLDSTQKTTYLAVGASSTATREYFLHARVIFRYISGVLECQTDLFDKSSPSHELFRSGESEEGRILGIRSDCKDDEDGRGDDDNEEEDAEGVWFVCCGATRRDKFSDVGWFGDSGWE